MNTSKLILAAALLLGSTATISAKTWRLNPNPEAKADFTSIADAMADDRVEEGDELLLDPGYYGSSSITELTKKSITISGPGHFLSENSTWRSAGQATMYSIHLSENSTIQGCTITSTIYVGYNSKIRRCRVFEISTPGSTTSGLVTIENNFIKDCISGRINNATICNNICMGYISGNGYNCTIENNVIANSKSNYLLGQFCNSTIRNNILIASSESSYNLTDCIFVNNVLSNTNPLSDYPDNVYGATLENTFIDNISGDRYLLRDDSVAKGKATDGGDCGAFGGATPYVLSGIPLNMPHIVEALIPSAPTDGKLEIKLKVATQND